MTCYHGDSQNPQQLPFLTCGYRVSVCVRVCECVNACVCVIVCGGLRRVNKLRIRLKTKPAPGAAGALPETQRPDPVLLRPVSWLQRLHLSSSESELLRVPSSEVLTH